MEVVARALANGRTHPSSMTIFAHLFKRSVSHPKSYHSDIKYHWTLNILFSAQFGKFLKP